MNFDQFLLSDEVNPWLRERGLQMYVRRNRVYPGLIDISNVNAVKPGQGAYTAFMERYDHLHAFLFENTLTDRLADWHRRLGHAEIACEWGCPSFLNRIAVERGLGPIARIKA